MILTSAFSVFIVGFFGGFTGDFLSIWGMRQVQPEHRPDWLTSPFYWGTALVMSLIAGGVAFAYAYGHNQINVILAFQTGASTPLILKSFTTATAPPAEPKIG